MIIFLITNNYKVKCSDQYNIFRRFLRSFLMTYFYVVILESHEEGEESFGRDPKSLQQIPLLEDPANGK